MTAKAIIREAYLVIIIARVAIDIAIDELMKRLLRADLLSGSPDPRRSSSGGVRDQDRGIFRIDEAVDGIGPR